MKRALHLILAIGVASQTALADPPASADTRKRAAVHYQKGITHYNLGEFANAIAEFKVAYELAQEPDLLFNIGQAYRLQDDYKQALFFYDAYLRLRPDAVNRGDVEARIAEAKKLLEDQKSLQTAPPHGAIEPPAAQPEPTEPAVPAPVATHQTESALAPTESPRKSSLTIAGWVTGAAGIATVATGIYFARRAGSGWDELNQLSDERGTWSDHYVGVERDAQRSERIALGLVVAGTAAIAAGGVLWYLGWRRDRSSTAALAISPTTSGWQASLAWEL